MFRNNKAVRIWLDEWIRQQENEHRGYREQRVMNALIQQQIYNDFLPECRIFFMPFSFCYVYDATAENEVSQKPVWLHWQMSRDHNPTNPHYKTAREARDKEMQAEGEYIPNNIVNSDFSIPNESITIVGTALSGKDQWGRIPEDSYKIALNAAITIPDIDWDAWLCVDNLIPDKDYFEPALKRFKGAKIFKYQRITEFQTILKDMQKKHPNCVIEIGTNLLELQPVNRYPKEGENIYLLNCLYSFKDRERMCVKGEFRNGATVAGFALQLGWYYGVEKIFLHGIEMRGNRYSAGERKSKLHEATMPWIERIAMNAFIRKIKASGVEVSTLTLTTLEVDWHGRYSNPVFEKGDRF